MIQKKSDRTFSHRIANLFKRSAIVSALCRLFSSIYKKAIYGFFGTLFTLYGSFEEKLKNSFFANIFSRRKTNGYHRPLSYRASKAYETSLFARAAETVKWSVLSCPMNIFGILFFSFGFYSMVIILLKKYAFSLEPASELSVMTSAIFIVVSIMLLFSKKTFIDVVNESHTLNFIFFDFLNMRKISAEEHEKPAHSSAGLAVIFGIFLGALSLVVEPYITAVAIFAAISGIILLHSPESGIITMFLLIPFVPTMFLLGLVILTALSLFFKVVRRKRLIKFSLIDLTVAIFALFIVSGGFISTDINSSMPKMLVFLCFISSYFIIKNIIRSDKLTFSCIRSLTTSASLVSVIGIFQYFFGSVSTIWQDAEMFADIKGRAVSTWSNPNVLGEYLILVAPIIFAMFVVSKSARDKFRYFISFMLCCSCLIFTWSRGAWLGFIAAVLIFIIISSHKSVAFSVLLLPAALLGASFLIDTSVLNRLSSIGNTSDSSTLYRLNIWKGTLSMLSDTWLYGIGIGTEAFSAVYPRYSLSGTETAPHSHSLYLQIISETGVFSLIFFFVFCFAFFGMVLYTMKNHTSKKYNIILIGFLCGVLAFLVQGATDYVWYNYRIFLLFWAVIGLASSVASNCRENSADQSVYIR